MAIEREDKVVIIATHGPDDQERATLPFMMATAAQAMDTKAVVILQGASVLLAEKNVYEHVRAAGLPPLKDLVEAYTQAGGTLLVCTPCVQQRETKELLAAGAELIAGARVVQESITAAAVLNY